MLEDYHSLGSPLFLFEPPDRVELSSQDYKSCVITDIPRRLVFY